MDLQGQPIGSAAAAMEANAKVVTVVTLDPRAGLALAALAALSYALHRVRLWWERRTSARLRAELDVATAERDREHATAVAATRTAELTADQRQADAAGETAAREIRHAPHAPDPIAELRAVDRAARELSAARRQGADGGHGGAPAMPPRRR